MAEVVREATDDRLFLEACGFKVLDPVNEENVQPKNQLLQSPKEKMDVYWKRDREMIAEADVLFNMSPHAASLGVMREHGLMQYHYKKPVVSIFPAGKLPLPGAVCYYEDAIVTDSILHAACQTWERFRTPWQRFKYRLWRKYVKET